MFEKYILDNFFYEDEISIQDKNGFLDYEIDYIKLHISSNPTLIASVFSSLIYRDLVYIRKFCKEIGVKYTVYKTNNNMVYGIFSVKNSGVYLTFKGTSSVSDFFSDINIKLKETPIGLVHTGFYEYLIENHESIFYNLKEFKKEKIIVTGHSLGAALSVIFYKLYKEKIDNISNINFGCPKIGNDIFCKGLTTTRVVNNFDIVTFVPFSWNYTHIDSLQKLYNWKVLFFSIKQHDIRSYYFNLKKYIKI